MRLFYIVLIFYCTVKREYLLTVLRNGLVFGRHRFLALDSLCVNCEVG